MRRAATLFAALAVAPLAGCNAPAGEPSAAAPESASATTHVGPREVWQRCVAMRKVRPADMRPLETVEACRDLFRGRCRDALYTARPGLTVEEGLAIVKACAEEYCPLSQPAMVCRPRPKFTDFTHGMQSFVRFALSDDDAPGSNTYDRASIGEMMGKELLPTSPVIGRVTVVDGFVTVALDGGPATKLPPHPGPEHLREFAEAAQKADADAVGIALYGTGGLDAKVKDALGVALLRASVLDVYHCDHRPVSAQCPR